MPQPAGRVVEIVAWRVMDAVDWPRKQHLPFPKELLLQENHRDENSDCSDAGGPIRLRHAFAADTKAARTKAPDAKMTPQQEKMKTCNAEATGKTGDERKAFMKTCLSAKPAKTESKMAMCNKKTAGMKAEDARKRRASA